MKNIGVLALDKYKDTAKYEKIEEGMYVEIKDTTNSNCRMALTFELEEGEDSQYPLEDVLDKYRIQVSDFITTELNTAENGAELLNVELAGGLKNLQLAKSIIGKRVYNNEVVGDDGETYMDLIIE